MRSEEKHVTAQPKPISDDVGTHELREDGLSIEPEEMGQSFLRYATEQANYETERGAGVDELFPDGESGSDDALDSAHFSPDASIWRNTVDLAAGTRRIDDLTRESVPPVPEEDDELGPELRVRRGVAEIDLTESVIEEASLLDEESEVLGEVIPKEPRTEDGGHHKSRPRP
jgi:hypothetical protein